MNATDPTSKSLRSTTGKQLGEILAPHRAAILVIAATILVGAGLALVQTGTLTIA